MFEYRAEEIIATTYLQTYLNTMAKDGWRVIYLNQQPRSMGVNTGGSTVGGTGGPVAFGNPNQPTHWTVVCERKAPSQTTSN